MFKMQIAAILAAAAMISGPAFAKDDGRLTVTGSGTAYAAPDIAMIRAGVQFQAATAEEALKKMSAGAEKLIAEAKALGVAPEDMQTSGLSLSPVYDDYDRRKPGEPAELVGFRASTDLMIRMRKIDETGGVIGALVSAGANSLDGVSFAVDNPQPLMDEAQKDAIADARRQAELYAEAAGVDLGDIISIDETGGGVRPEMGMMRAADMSFKAPVEAGRSEISASVRIVWEIKPGKDD